MITFLELQSFFNDEAEVDPEELWGNLTDEEIATDERSLECLVQAISAVSGRAITIEGDTE